MCTQTQTRHNATALGDKTGAKALKKLDLFNHRKISPNQLEYNEN